MFGRQSGQALPVALAVLGVGTLVVAPFLTHTSSGLISSRIHGTSIAERYASDAGIEHATWRLTNEGLADMLPEKGDSISYQLSRTVNCISPDITVTNSSGTPRPPGDILDMEVDTLEYDPEEGKEPDIVHVSGDIYAIAYQGKGKDGFVKTVQISASGQITDTVIDSLEFDTYTGQYPDIIRVSENVFAIAYCGNCPKGYLKTIRIESDGQIANSVIDTLKFDSRKGCFPDIINVKDDTYAIAYQGPRDDGYITTVTIAADGQIGSGVIDSLEYDKSKAISPRIINAGSNIYAIAYEGQGGDGFLTTLEIADNGQISNSVIDSLEFDKKDGKAPDIINVTSGIFAIAYDGQASKGYVVTVGIGPGGQITDKLIDTLVFDQSNGKTPCLIHITGDVFAIAYRGPGDGGYLRTVEIGAGGDITDGIIDSFEFHTSNGWTPVITHVTGDIYALVYMGKGGDGFLRTIDIETDDKPSLVFEVVSTGGDVTIRANVQITGTVAIIQAWALE
jgi:hypothetical protein